MLDKFKKDISVELVEFVASPQFAQFKEIMFQMYVAKLLDFQNNIVANDAETDKKILNIYLNLSTTIKIMSEEVMINRREQHERTSI